MPVTFLQPHTMGRTTGSGWQWWPLSISPFTHQIPLISTISRCKFCCKYCKSFCLKSISKCYILFQVHVLSVLVHIQHFILLLFRIPFCRKSFVENELPQRVKYSTSISLTIIEQFCDSHLPEVVLHLPCVADHELLLLGPERRVAPRAVLVQPVPPHRVVVRDRGVVPREPLRDARVPGVMMQKKI